MGTKDIIDLMDIKQLYQHIKHSGDHTADTKPSEIVWQETYQYNGYEYVFDLREYNKDGEFNKRQIVKATATKIPE